jgi:GATA-binding protein, other eukaryote
MTKGRLFVMRESHAIPVLEPFLTSSSPLFLIAVVSSKLFDLSSETSSNKVYSYKLHGASRPISMKSDVIRKRSRHDARRNGGNGTNSSETPSDSRGASPGASPEMERSPTLAPDSTTQMSYEFNEDSDFQASQSELIGALGNSDQGNYTGTFNPFPGPFPGPYHPDYLAQQSATPADALPFASAEETESESKEESRTNKRRRMSTDSESEPPSSAVSFSSYNEGYSSQSSATSNSQRSSMEFPFNQYPSYNILRGSGNTFWHPPMAIAHDSPQFIHPPMLPSEDSHMDYLHPPMLPQEEENLFNQYLHPPMVPPEDSSKSHMNNSLQTYTGNGSVQSDYFDAPMNRF